MQLKWGKFEDVSCLLKYSRRGWRVGLKSNISTINYSESNLLLATRETQTKKNNCSMSSSCHHHAAGRANLQENVPDGNKTTAWHSRTLLWVFKPWFWTLMWQKRGGSDWENEGNCTLMQRLVSHTVRWEKLIVSVKMQKQLPRTVKNDGLGVTARSH